MTDPARTGLMLLCCMTGGPLAVGLGFGWWLRGRVSVYGPLGALLPRFLRERMA